MTKTSAIDRSALAVVLTAVIALALLLVPAARPGPQSISVNPAMPTAATGVSFTVSTGGGNREFASVRVTCSDGSGAEVYATVLTVEVPAKSVGTSATIYPPPSACLAELIKQMSIGKARVLAGVSFTVAP